jgi:ABC-type transport system involved in Fe-S cluster assembly fused permease/ATPase subunit
MQCTFLSAHLSAPGCRQFAAPVHDLVLAFWTHNTLLSAPPLQTAVRGKQRIKRLDNDINAQLLESLFNVEPMLLLGGQPREAAAFDKLLKGFQDAAVRFEYVTGFLTAVQVGLRLCSIGALLMETRLRCCPAERQLLVDLLRLMCSNTMSMCGRRL